MTPPAAPVLVVEGAGGLLEGERCELARGETLVVGRSRSCQLSLRRVRGFRSRRDQEELLGSPRFRRVSRVHCEIAHLPDGRAEIRDLSRNGTLVDGRRLARALTLAPGDPAVEVVLADPGHGRLRVRFEPAPLAAD